ncbi:melanotransferrin [Condylostylus longicornis]|uniref:melanotransferrin n=1 Tax=Condylostylus longicornis TaxID=2530218 RepID=UPI00244DF80F|nr:melanotransferrin [Condylostylus longicornis]
MNLLSFNILIVTIPIIYGQYFFNEHKIDHIIWCTKSEAEQYKCQNLTKILEYDRQRFDDSFLNLTCFMAFNTDECIHHIDRETAHITTLDAGDMFTAGRYNSLIPIMQEVSKGGFKHYYAVAVVKRDTLPDVHSLRDLRNKKACFPWVGSLAGWTVPLYTLQKHGGMEIKDCNNQVKTTAHFFNDSCAVNSLTDKYNPLGDNSDKLCSLCSGKVQSGRCTPADPYYGFDGAFRCLLEVGDIAFLRHTTVNEMLTGTEFRGQSVDNFQLLCKDGRRQPISEYLQCNWGEVPTDAIAVSSARPFDERKQFQKFLLKVSQLYGGQTGITFNNSSYSSNYDSRNQGTYNNNPSTRYDDNFNRKNRLDYGQSDRNSRNNDRYNNEGSRFGRIDDSFPTETNSIRNENTSLIENFKMFDSKIHGKQNLMFQDSSVGLELIKEEEQSFRNYLGAAIDYIYEIRNCPIGVMKLCVTSDAEYEKCHKMKIALKAQLLKPELTCFRGHSHIYCMQSIQQGAADVAVFDAGDVYTGGWFYQLIPFMSEVYNLGEPEYYVVAVGKEEDLDTELTYLKGKYTCHTGLNTAAGWTYPMAYLISNGWIRPYGCNSVRAAAEYFTKSCIPGAISNQYNKDIPYDSMCGLCHGSSFSYCRRDASEDYYGHTGAFRCLVEGGGQVAFVKHTTVSENTGGKRKEWWARNTLEDEFELLCPDGTRAEMSEYKTCNLGKVKANAIVARGGFGYNETELNAFINLFQYAQQLYGRKYVDEFSFSMFSSPAPYYDLIFQDATRQLQVIDKDKRSFDTYLGNDFLRARRITDCFASAPKAMSTNIFYTLTSLVLLSYLSLL